jgi:probable rRNA maturation factor
VDPDSKRVRVAVTDAAGRRVRDGGLGAWLTGVAPARAAGDVAIALVSDARIRALNKRYRRKDRATDVLSFGVDGVGSGRGSRAVPNGGGADAFLGDIVIAMGVARRQAKDAGHPLQTELRVLALHGLLHLLGYDHHAKDDGGRMARMEARLRRKGGLGAGLIERAGNSTSSSSSTSGPLARGGSRDARSLLPRAR